MATRKTVETIDVDNVEWAEISGMTPAFLFEETGDVFVGIFQEIRLLMVDEIDPETGEMRQRESRFYECIDPTTNDPIGFWGSGQLDWKFDRAEPPITKGDLIRVEYLGKQKVKDLPGDVRQYKLFRKEMPF